MMRLVVTALVIIVIAGGAIWLANRDTAQPLTRIEKVVPDNAIGR